MCESVQVFAEEGIKRLIDENNLALVAFEEDQALLPILETLTDRYKGRAAIAKAAMPSDAVTARYGVRQYPAVLVFHDGQVTAQAVGVQPESVYAAILDERLRESGGCV